jgi:hypothetical protein
MDPCNSLRMDSNASPSASRSEAGRTATDNSPLAMFEASRHRSWKYPTRPEKATSNRPSSSSPPDSNSIPVSPLDNRSAAKAMRPSGTVCLRTKRSAPATISASRHKLTTKRIRAARRAPARTSCAGGFHQDRPGFVALDHRQGNRHADRVALLMDPLFATGDRVQDLRCMEGIDLGKTAS